MTRRGEGGSVTAEAAVVLPALVAVAVVLVALIGALGAQLRCVDAARAGAREAARSAPRASVVEVAERAAGTSRAQVSVQGDDQQVRVVVRMPVAGLPHWAGRWWVSATSVVQVEPGPWAP